MSIERNRKSKLWNVENLPDMTIQERFEVVGKIWIAIGWIMEQEIITPEYQKLLNLLGDGMDCVLFHSDHKAAHYGIRESVEEFEIMRANMTVGLTVRAIVPKDLMQEILSGGGKNGH